MYEINAFFWYKAVFMAELLIAETLMICRLKKRKAFALRSIAAFLLCIGAAFAMPVADDGALYATFMYIAFFAVTLAALYFCYDVGFRIVVFCGLAGYAAQHIAFELFDICTVLMGLRNAEYVGAGSNPFASFVTVIYGSGNSLVLNAFTAVVYLSTVFITYWAVTRIASPRLDSADGIALKSGVVLGIFGLTVLFDVVLSAIVTEHGNKAFDKVYVLVADISNLFLCMLVLFMQFGTAKMLKTERELYSVNKIWSESKQQYAAAKRNIDMINIKCHDLKHQIRRMGAKNELAPAALDEMTELISVYDSDMKTGNAALDVILTEKSLYCGHSGITLSCMADGRELGFMRESDIYSVFGNLIDNAIEAVQKLGEDDRVIGISVKRINGFVFINVYNLYDGAVVFSDGLPVSTKGDAFNHGFGVRSVKAIVESYGGELKQTAENGVFNTDIIFPR